MHDVYSFLVSFHSKVIKLGYHLSTGRQLIHIYWLPQVMMVQYDYGTSDLPCLCIPYEHMKINKNHSAYHLQEMQSLALDQTVLSRSSIFQVGDATITTTRNDGTILLPLYR